MKIIKLCIFLLAIPALSYAFGFGGAGGGVRGVQIGTAGNYGLSMADNGASSFTCGDSVGHLFWESGVLKFCDPGSTTKTLAGGGGSLPSQTGNSGKYLTTNGTAASWGTVSGGTWGSITGTLSAQTDLQAALDAITAGGITMSTAIPTTAGSAYLNDSTHVLTVASSTGYTQFTGSHTPWDTTPDAFSFTDETDVAINTAKTSNAITVAGTNYPAAISVTGDTGYGYSKNSAACTATSGTVVAGDTVAACVTSSGSNSTTTTATVTIGGASDVYSVTTAAGQAGYSDSFTGADDTPLATHDSNWASPGSTYVVSSLEIMGNSVTTTGAYSIAGAYYNASTSDISQIISKAVTNSSQAIDKYVSVRNSDSAIGYSARLIGTTTGKYTSVAFKKSTAGLGSTCSGLSYSTTEDHVIKLVASGTSTVTLTFFVDGTQVCQTTDSSSTITSGHPGFYVTGNGTVGNNAFDDWQDY